MKARRSERFILRLTREERKTLNQLAAKRETSASQVIRRALRQQVQEQNATASK